MQLAEFVEERFELLHDRVRQQAARAAAHPSPDAIHDLRVSIRRLLQAMRAFRDLLPRKGRKRTRRQLRHWLNLAAEVRNRDIALELLTAAGAGPRSRLARELAAERAAAWQQLLTALPETKA